MGFQKKKTSRKNTEKHVLFFLYIAYSFSMTLTRVKLRCPSIPLLFFTSASVWEISLFYRPFQPRPPFSRTKSTRKTFLSSSLLSTPRFLIVSPILVQRHLWYIYSRWRIKEYILLKGMKTKKEKKYIYKKKKRENRSILTSTISSRTKKAKSCEWTIEHGMTKFIIPSPLGVNSKPVP